MSAYSFDSDNLPLKVHFESKKLIFLKVAGKFTQVSGEVHFDSNNLGESFFDLKIRTSSMTTCNQKRDAHLMSKDFLDEIAYKYIEFKSLKIERLSQGLSTMGYLTIKNNVNTIQVKFHVSGENVLMGSFSVNRADFTLGNQIPRMIIGRTIRVCFSLDLELVQRL